MWQSRAPRGLLDRYDFEVARAQAEKLGRIELPELPAEKRWKHLPGWVAQATATDGTPRFGNGAMGDCWLISLLAAFAEYPALITSRFVNTRLALHHSEGPVCRFRYDRTLWAVARSGRATD